MNNYFKFFKPKPHLKDKRKVYLHVGPHKTATTAIQKSLQRNTKVLSSNNLSYPLLGEVFTGKDYISDKSYDEFAHHHFCEALKKDNQGFVFEFIEKLKKIETDAVISSENFVFLQDDKVAALADLLDDFDVQVIYTKRYCADLLVSNWQENVKHGSFLSWSQYFFQHIHKPFSSNVLNSLLVLDRYRKAFGQDAITIIDYQQFDQDNKSIISGFYEVIGIKNQGIKFPSHKINQSMPYYLIEVIRAMNIRVAAHGLPVGDFTRRKLLEIKKDKAHDRLFEALEKIIMPYTKHIRLDDSPTINLLEDEFMAAYGTNVFGKPYKSKQKKDCVYRLPGDGWLLESEVVPLLGKLENMILEGISKDS